VDKFKNSIYHLANKAGWPIGVMATLGIGVLLVIAQASGAVIAFLILLIIYALLWFIFGKTFFKNPPL